MSLHLHIERVVLEGWDLPPGQRALLLQALAGDLATAFRAWEPSPAWRRARRVQRLSAADLPAAPHPAQLSRHLSRALHQRLSAPPGDRP